MGVTVLVSEIKRVKNYPDFEKLAHVIQYGLLGFIVKSIEGESMEANNFSQTLYKWICWVNNSSRYHPFVALRPTKEKASQTVIQQNEKLKKAKFEGAWDKIIQTFNRFFFFHFSRKI